MSASYGLIGHPLGHSLSPFIHKRLFALSQYDAQYQLYDIAPSQLGDMLPRLLTQVRGVNVTIPHKQQVEPFLSAIDDSAKLCGAVNCIAVTDNGAIGHNTDICGFVKALQAADIPLVGRVLIAGAGGVSAAFAATAVQNGCEVILFKSHNLAQATALAQDLNRSYRPCKPVTATDRIPQSEFDLLINATPVGMYPHIDECPLPDEAFLRAKAAFDAIYNPRETVFLKKAATSGAKTAGGMDMLVWQAVVSHEIWYGASFDTEDIERLIADCYDELARFTQRSDDT